MEGSGDWWRLISCILTSGENVIQSNMGAYMDLKFRNVIEITEASDWWRSSILTCFRKCRTSMLGLRDWITVTNHSDSM